MSYLRLCGVFVACALLLALSPARAATITYSYTGNLFDTNDTTNPQCTIGAAGCFTHITASIELAGALGVNQPLTSISPTAWSISDGLTTITDLTPDFFLFTLQVGTNASGDIDKWRFITANSALGVGEVESMQTTFGAGFGTVDDTRYCTVGTTGSCSYVAVASINNSPGSWAASTVPVPAAAWLFASGLLGLLGVARRRI